MGGGGRLFAPYGHEEILQKSSLKPWSALEITLQECSLLTLFKIVRKILIRP